MTQISASSFDLGSFGLSAYPHLPKLPDSPFFWLPIAASNAPAAQNLDWLFDVSMWLCTVITLIVVVAMSYLVVKYRAKNGRSANETVEDSPEHNTALELTWSFIPMVIVIPIFVWGFKGYVDLRTPPKEAYEIHATGQKWNWSFTYSTGYVDDALHVPVDRDVRVTINSVDVLHSLYLPAFRTKMDAVPGRYTTIWFHADKTGTTPIFCAEYCGKSHSDMLSEVIVHEPGGFETWLTKASVDSDPDPAARGQHLFEKRGCTTCHSTDGTIKVGPSFKGVYGKTETFEDGSSGAVDDNYIRQSLQEPQAKVVKGFPGSMPTFKGQLKDNQISDLIAFIQSQK